MALSVGALFSVATVESLFALGIEVAKALGLPTTSWRAGDPTRSLYKYLAEVLASLESVSAEFVKAGFLSSATGDWLKILASEVYGLDSDDFEATYATPTVTVTNTGGGLYAVEVGDLTFKASTSDKTYHNTNALTLSAGGIEIFELVADEAGSDSSVAPNEVDEMVTQLLGVVVNSSTAAVATDSISEEEIRELCTLTLGALSPDGPGDAYEYVARSRELTGVTEVTRARAIGNPATGLVAVYVATSSGPATAPMVTAVQSAVDQWATPLCTTATVAPAVQLDTSFDIEIEGTDIPAGAATTITNAIVAYLATLPIGIEAQTTPFYKVIHDAVPEVDNIPLLDIAFEDPLVAGSVHVLDDIFILEV